MIQQFDMLCNIKLKQQIVASDHLHILKVSSTCQKGHGIILTENKFVHGARFTRVSVYLGTEAYKGK